ARTVIHTLPLHDALPISWPPYTVRALRPFDARPARSSCCRARAVSDDFSKYISSQDSVALRSGAEHVSDRATRSERWCLGRRGDAESEQHLWIVGPAHHRSQPGTKGEQVDGLT